MSVNINDVKNVLEQIYDVFDSIEKNGLKPDEFKDFTLRDSFETSAISMLMYFSASDGKLSVKEAQLMNELFDYNLSPDDYIKVINDHDIYSTKFEERMWPSLEVLKIVDDMMKRNGQQVAMPAVFQAIEGIAKLLIQIDDDVDDQEREDFNILFTNLKNRYMPPEDIFFNRSKNATTSTSDNSLKDYYLKKKR